MASENEGKRETLAAIAAEIRSYGDRPPPKCAWLDIADRIEAIDSADAWRSLYTPGNAAAMREALREAIGETCAGCARDCDDCVNLKSGWMKKAKAALFAPVRQCDVGTPEEQLDRYCRHCQTHCISCARRHACNVCGERYRLRCFANWAQTPYEAQEGAGE